MRSQDICQAMLKFAAKFKENQEITNLKLQHFTDGFPFVCMLNSSNTISLTADELEFNSTKWISKVSNLKKILTKIHSFLELVNEKTDRIKDIDVVEIAKHTSPEHLAKLFEVVISVLMKSAQKEKYIQLIMTLDESAQNTFVEIIQNSLDQQLIKSEQDSHSQLLEEQIGQMKRENIELTNEISELARKNKNLQREVKDLREKIAIYEQQFEQSKTADYSLNSENLQSQLSQQRVLIDNLKIKLLTIVRENELQMSQLREEVTILKMKTKDMEDVEAALEQYKELYNQSSTQLQRIGELEKEKRKMIRQLEEKELIIKKLHDRIETTIQRNYSMQENQIYMKMELEKREARFKQLEKEVKTRLKSEPSEISPRHVEIDIREDERDEINYLQEELNKSKNSLKQLQKQSMRNRKKLERLTQLQADKKKLERIILEVNRSKDCEIQMLVVSLFELRNENVRIFQLLKNASSSNQKTKSFQKA